MKIVVIGNSRQKNEWMPEGANWPSDVEWSETIPSCKESGAAVIDLLFDNSPSRADALRRSGFEMVIINSVLYPLRSETQGFIRMNGWYTFLKRDIVEVAGPNDRIVSVGNVFSKLNKKVEWVKDQAGFIAARVVATVINEAYFALGEGVSSKEEIDIAMKLGTNYPYGPFEWGEKIGIANIESLLSTLAAEHERYQPAPLLLKEAQS